MKHRRSEMAKKKRPEGDKMVRGVLGLHCQNLPHGLKVNLTLCTVTASSVGSIPKICFFAKIHFNYTNDIEQISLQQQLINEILFNISKNNLKYALYPPKISHIIVYCLIWKVVPQIPLHVRRFNIIWK